jgi:para-nitrobenzyl esterase
VRNLCAPVFILSLLLTACVVGCPSTPPEFTVAITKDIVYGTGNVSDPAAQGGYAPADLLMDLHAPDPRPAGAIPAVVIMHGGGFTEGSKEDERIIAMARYLAQRGFAAFAISYRLDDANPPSPSWWSVFSLTSSVHAAIVDAKTAVRHVRARADEYGIDPDRIGFIGASAGAVAGAAVAVTDAGSFATDGSSFPHPPGNYPGESARVQAYVHLWGGVDHVLADIGRGDPPTMIVHGTDDDRFFTWFESSERFHGLLELYDIPHEFYQAKGYGHGAWDYTYRGKNLHSLVHEFLRDQL